MSKEENLREINKTIEYEALINQMNEEAFTFCVDNLFHLFDFQVLKPEDMRRIDLLEYLVRFRNTFSFDKAKKGYLNFYLDVVKSYIQNIIRCVPDSRAYKCRNRAYQVIENATKLHGNQNDVIDAVILFLSLYREFEGQEDNKDYYIDDVTICAGTYDAETLNDLMYSDVLKKTGKFDFMRKQNDDVGFCEVVMYINSIIYLALGLQERGLF